VLRPPRQVYPVQWWGSISNPRLLPPRPIRMVAAPAACLLGPGEITQSPAATEPAAADATIELPAATPCFADTDVTADR
jgi:hypothetical protein